MSKKTIILILLIVVLLLHIGIGWVRNNFQLGQDMYDAAVDLAIKSTLLADELDYLQKEFNKEDTVQTPVTFSVLNYISATFEYGIAGNDVPILNTVMSKYYEQNRTLFFTQDENLKIRFTDEKKSAKVSSFKAALRILEDHLYSFIERYNQMSFLEKCFTSWSNERDILSESVKLPQ